MKNDGRVDSFAESGEGSLDVDGIDLGRSFDAAGDRSGSSSKSSAKIGNEIHICFEQSEATNQPTTTR
jgi:hypothetical protein